MADEGRLAALRQKFVARSREQAARITELRALLKTKAAMTPEALGELKRLCHSLHGAAGTFGFEAVSDAAATAEDLSEDLVAAGAAPDVVLYAKLDAALGQVLERIAHIA